MESSILSGLSASLVGSNIQKHKVAEGSSILGSLSPRQTFKKNDENFGHCDQCSCKMSCFRNNKTLKLCFSHGLSAGSLTFWCFLWSTNHLMSNLRSHQEAYNQRQTCDPTWLPRRWWRRGRTLPSCCRQTGEQTLLLCRTIGKLKSLDYTKSIKEIWRHKWQLLFRFFCIMISLSLHVKRIWHPYLIYGLGWLHLHLAEENLITYCCRKFVPIPSFQATNHVLMSILTRPTTKQHKYQKVSANDSKSISTY